MKWAYIIIGVLLFFVLCRSMSQYSIRHSDVIVIHSGAQP